MNQTSNLPTLTFDRINSLLEAELSRMEGGNAVLTRKAFLSMRRSAMQLPPQKRTMAEVIGVWKAAMATKGVSRLTSRRYLESIRALYNHALERNGLEEDSRLEIEPFLDPASAWRDVLKCLRSVERRSRRLAAAMRLPLDVLLFSIIGGGLTLEQTVALRYDSPQAEELRRITLLGKIADRYAGSRRKYVFPLSQGRFTDRSIARSIADKILALLPMTGGATLSQPVSLADMGGLFVAAASEAGLTLPEIRSLLPEKLPGSLAHLEEIRQESITAEERLRLLGYLADMVADTCPRWFAMRLRKGVKPSDIAERITASGDPRRRLTVYYPVEEIAARVGKKITRETRAFISDVLFFRSDPAEVRPLFLTLGDLAWCYRTTPSPLSPYAAISDREMKAFQQRIGHFSEEMEIEASAPSLFEIGQQVKVTGGPLEGYRGIVLTLPGGTRRQLRILLTPDRGLTLTLDIPDSFISPLEQ